MKKILFGILGSTGFLFLLGFVLLFVGLFTPAHLKMVGYSTDLGSVSSQMKDAGMNLFEFHNNITGGLAGDLADALGNTKALANTAIAGFSFIIIAIVSLLFGGAFGWKTKK